MKTLLAFTLVFILSSCGKDVLNPKTTSSQTALQSKECTFTNLGAPVCGYLAKDNSLHDYFNAQYAECVGAEVKYEGHCDCATNTIQVCAEDGANYSECEAKQKNLKIIKYTPCQVKDL